MSDWPILDVAIGLTLLFTAVSLLCSTITEGIASVFRWRASDLEKWLGHALQDPAGAVNTVDGAATEFFENPLIKPFVKPGTTAAGGFKKWLAGGRRPSYVCATAFAPAVIDEYTRAKNALSDTHRIARTQMSGSELKDELSDAHAAIAILERSIPAGEATADRLRKEVESWYNRSMDRVSGWYKRRAQYCLAVIGLMVAVICNIDAVHVAQTLWSQPNVRTAVVAQASKTVNAQTSNGSGKAANVNKASSQSSLQTTVDDLNKLQVLGMPFGWEFQTKTHAGNFPHGLRAYLVKLLGFGVTTVAVLLGAPFWFDLLGTLVNIRGAGPAPGETSPIKKKRRPQVA